MSADQTPADRERRSLRLRIAELETQRLAPTIDQQIRAAAVTAAASWLNDVTTAGPERFAELLHTATNIAHWITTGEHPHA